MACEWRFRRAEWSGDACWDFISKWDSCGRARSQGSDGAYRGPEIGDARAINIQILAGGKRKRGGGKKQDFASFETLALGDLSLLVKFGVQFGLWGGAIAGAFDLT